MLHRYGSLTQIVKTGWWHSVALVRTLEAVGLGDACEGRRAHAIVGTGTLAWLWAGLIALVALVAFVAVGLRAQRRREPVRV